MICSSRHKWTIARENRWYCMTEIVCEKCGLVFVVNLSHNGHNGHLRTAETPGYRARDWRKYAARKFNGSLIPARSPPALSMPHAVKKSKCSYQQIPLLTSQW